METIKAAIGLSPTTTADADATEPVAGEKGQGNGLEPYDAGNNPEACEAAERVRAEEDRGNSGDNVALGVSNKTEQTADSNGTANDGEEAPTSEDKHEALSKTEHGNNNDEKANVNGNSSSSPADGKPKENPSAIPTAGGEKVGTQPVPGRERESVTPAVADTTGKADGAKQQEDALPQTSSARPDDGVAVNGTASDAAPPAAAYNVQDDGKRNQAVSNDSTTPTSAPIMPATETPPKTATPEKPISSAQKAIQDSNGGPVGSGLERKPSKMSRIVNRLKGRKSRGGDGEDNEKK